MATIGLMTLDDLYIEIIIKESYFPTKFSKYCRDGSIRNYYKHPTKLSFSGCPMYYEKSDHLEKMASSLRSLKLQILDS